MERYNGFPSYTWVLSNAVYSFLNLSFDNFYTFRALVLFVADANLLLQSLSHCTVPHILFTFRPIRSEVEIWIC